MRESKSQSLRKLIKVHAGRVIRTESTPKVRNQKNPTNTNTAKKNLRGGFVGKGPQTRPRLPMRAEALYRQAR